MASNNNDQRSVFDKMMGMAEDFVDNVERATDTATWKVEQITDAHDGSIAYQIRSSAGQKLETRDQNLADRVCELLNV